MSVILTETPADHGMSITNAATHIHRQLREQFPAGTVEQIEH